MAEPILVVVDDLFFLAKIQQTAKLLGTPVEPVEPAALRERLAGGGVAGIILDLNHHSGAALGILDKIKADPSTSTVPVVGFLSHIQADLARSARSAGCDTVMARSGFAQQLAKILNQLSEGSLHGLDPGSIDAG